MAFDSEDYLFAKSVVANDGSCREARIVANEEYSYHCSSCPISKKLNGQCCSYENAKSVAMELLSEEVKELIES